MSAIKIAIAAVPPVITESVITALRAHGYVLARRVGESGALEQLPPVRADAVFRELGRNAAQALVCSDESIDDHLEPAQFCAVEGT